MVFLLNWHCYLDISAIDGFRELEIFAEALLLKVAHGKLVSKRQKMQDTIPENGQR